MTQEILHVHVEDSHRQDRVQIGYLLVLQRCVHCIVQEEMIIDFALLHDMEDEVWMDHFARLRDAREELESGVRRYTSLLDQFQLACQQGLSLFPSRHARKLRI